MQELNDLLRTMRDFQTAMDIQEQRPGPLSQLILEEMAKRFTYRHNALAGCHLRLQTHAGGCWCILDQSDWLVRDEGEVHTGLYLGVLPWHEFCHQAGDWPVPCNQPALTIEAEDGRIWLAQMIRINLDKCEALDPLPDWNSSMPDLVVAAI